MQIRDSFNQLDLWIEQNGWGGYDPYDILGNNKFRNINNNKYRGHIFKYGSFVTSYFINHYPRLSRTLFRVKPSVNPKAMALFARGYLNAFKKTNLKKYLFKALFCLKWLENNSVKNYSGYCWGYPFDWDSFIFIPKKTPSGVVTSIAAHAFIDAYEILSDIHYLKIAESCCMFIINDLNTHDINEDQLCFSYTPLDRFHVHNANLFSASVLLRVYSMTKNQHFKNMGVNALNFTVKNQNTDGSWYYWWESDKYDYNIPKKSLFLIDNYHTGFVLECINICKKALKTDFKYEKELKNGMDFYYKNLFLKDGTPKFSNEVIYPIDIHSYSQAIITFSEIPNYKKGYSKKIAEKCINNMKGKDGHFYYRKYENRLDKMAYMRWGQAWMLRSLSLLI